MTSQQNPAATKAASPAAASPAAASPAAASPAAASSAPPANARSEGLLPADENDPNLQVAEEVAFDLQSDQARRVGAMPQEKGPANPADAVAASLQKDEGGNKSGAG